MLAAILTDPDISVSANEILVIGNIDSGYFGIGIHLAKIGIGSTHICRAQKLSKLAMGSTNNLFLDELRQKFVHFSEQLLLPWCYHQC
jgi:hypothetical protein